MFLERSMHNLIFINFLFLFSMINYFFSMAFFNFFMFGLIIDATPAGAGHSGAFEWHHLLIDDEWQLQELLLTDNRLTAAAHENRNREEPHNNYNIRRQPVQQYTKVLTQEDKDAAVKCHNKYRSQLALGYAFNKGRRGNKMPKASRMYKIRWDDNLAQGAAQWANQCITDHSKNGWAGENLAMHSSGTFTTKYALVDACNRWWAELGEVGFNKQLKMVEKNFKAIGHWTQMAWQNTDAIGCAVAQNCPNTQWKTYVVCWYYEPGNYIGKQVYEAGEPCSKCGKDKCDSVRGLCYKN